MFDPSKINLDLNDLNKNYSNQNNNTQTSKKSDNIQNNNQEKKDIFIKQDKEVKLEQKQEKIEKKEIKEEKVQKTNFDINIKKLKDLLKYLVLEKFDFFKIEPSDDKVKISFIKDKIVKLTKYIKYPTYLNILLEAKKTGKLKIEETDKGQENKNIINFNGNTYSFFIKTIPSNLGEKLFIQLKETNKKISKQKEKVSIGKLLSILFGMLFVAILLGGVFMAVVIFNSNSVSDLQFFNNIGINTNAIKDFAAKLVNIFFGFTILVEIIFLFVFSYKAFLTKKEFKQKKISRIILAMFFLILTIVTFITWMFLSKKINNLKGLNYGKIEFYDNSKFNSELFSHENSKIDINQNIIGPTTIRFDNKEFIKKLKDDLFTPKKVIWKIGKEEFEKPVNDNYFIYTFDKKGLFPIRLIVNGVNAKGEIKEKTKDIGNININNLVKIEEIKLDNSGKKFIFDASDLSSLGKIYWYYIPSLKGKSDDEINKIVSKALSKEKRIGYKFNSKNIFEGEEIYAIKIISGDKTEDEIKKIPLSKIFIVGITNNDKVYGEIKAKKDLEDYRKYKFRLNNIKEKFGGAYIKEVLWKIEDISKDGEKIIIPIKKQINLVNIEDSSEIEYTFMASGEHNIYLNIKDSENNTYEVKPITVNIAKQVNLRSKLKFRSNSQELDSKKNILYEKVTETYFLENILAPSILEIDASKIKTINPKYGLNKVSWDLNDDGIFEEQKNKIKFNVFKSGVKTIKVKYEFVNKFNPEDKVTKIQTISISALDKDAILDLKFIMDNNYVPVVVGFDASKSKITGKNIDKFIFDYGDGTEPESRDAINSGHKYTKSGIYNVILTVVSSDGTEYSLTKKLILKDRKQKAMIRSSLNKAPIYQSIDFSAEESVGEVARYFWDFGDGDVSYNAHTSHFYKKPGKYKVQLTLEFTNNNILSTSKEIEIYEN